MKIQRTLVLGAICLSIVTSSIPAHADPRSRPDHDAQLIAFAATDDDHLAIFTIGSDGRHLRQLTHDSNNYRNPDWSPDGNRLVLEADDGVSTSWLVITRADGSHSTKISVPDGVQVGQPSFSPDGRRIYFERYDGVADSIYRSDLTGRRLERVTNPPAGYGDTDPNVSPDGRTLSFVRLSDGSEDGPAALFVQDLATGQVQQLTSYATNVAIKQDWSPDGRRIGFTRDGYDRPPGANSNMAVIKPNGRHRRDITHFTDGTTQAFFGSFSPDGRWIVMRREDGDLPSLVKIRPDGSHAVTIMSIPGFTPRSIAWGPARSR